MPEIAPQTGKIKVYAGNSSGTFEQNFLLVSRPSEHSRRVFATSALYTGNLGGLSGADQKCQERADNPDNNTETNDSLGGTWKAWLSDGQTTTLSRLEHSNWFYKRLDGNAIANNWDDLVNQGEPILYNPINVTEIGNTLPATSEWDIWTNTSVSGGGMLSSPIQTCNNWTLSSSSQTGYGGYSGKTNPEWTANFNLSFKNCDTLARLYCFEQGTSSPSPTPSPSPTSSPTPSPSPTPNPTPSPSPTPRAIGYAIAETSAGLDSIQEPTTRVESFPVTIDYTFQNTDPGDKVLFVKFFYSDGTSQVKFSSLIYRPQTPSPSPTQSPTLEPTASPSPTPEPTPTATPSPSPSPTPTPIPGDANSDGVVDIVDYSILQSEFGKHEPPELRADFNNDGQVDIVDYSILVKNFAVGCDTMTCMGITPSIMYATATLSLCKLLLYTN